MKITLEIDMEDGVPAEAISGRFSNVASYVAGYISTCHVKAGRIEVHETVLFGSVFRVATNVKITIDRSEPVPERQPLKVFASHAFTGRCMSLGAYGVVIAESRSHAAHLMTLQIIAEGLPEQMPLSHDDMIEVDLSVPKAYIVKDE
jgi:hypothetical protein